MRMCTSHTHMWEERQKTDTATSRCRFHATAASRVAARHQFCPLTGSPVPKHISDIAPLICGNFRHCPVEKMQKNGHYFTTKETKAWGRKVMLLERGTLKVKIQIFWAQTHCAHFHFMLNSDQGKTLIISKPLAMASTLFLLPRRCIHFLS